MSKEKYIHEQHSVHHILYHIIFCPKRRRKVLIGPVHDRLKQIIEEVAQAQAWGIERLIKGRSSHLLREEFPLLMRMPSLWTRSTFYSTAGHVSQDIIDRYIERQAKS